MAQRAGEKFNIIPPPHTNTGITITPSCQTLSLGHCYRLNRHTTDKGQTQLFYYTAQQDAVGLHSASRHTNMPQGCPWAIQSSIIPPLLYLYYITTGINLCGRRIQLYFL